MSRIARMTAKFASWPMKAVLSVVAVAAISGVGVLATGATFTDQTTMAQISVTGGTLDLTANNGNGPNQAWAGSLAVALTNFQPGQEASGTVDLKNNGTLPFALTTTKTGADTSACFVYYFRETAATGATKAGVQPVNITGMGTLVGADGTMAAFAAAVTSQTLADNGADTTWEIDDVKTYTLTVRMKSTCATNAANGTMNFAFDAVQV